MVKDGLPYNTGIEMEKKTIDIDGMTYGERELSQLIRRRMMTRSVKDKTKYTRKEKHKKPITP